VNHQAADVYVSGLYTRSSSQQQIPLTTLKQTQARTEHALEQNRDLLD
jgi:hypothetical protein